MSCNSTTGFLFCVYFCYSSPFGDGAPAFCAQFAALRDLGERKNRLQKQSAFCVCTDILIQGTITPHRRSKAALSPSSVRFTGFSQLLFFTQKVPLQSSGLGLKVIGLASLGRKCNRHHAGLGTKRIIP